MDRGIDYFARFNLFDSFEERNVIFFFFYFCATKIGYWKVFVPVEI